MKKLFIVFFVLNGCLEMNTKEVLRDSVAIKEEVVCIEGMTFIKFNESLTQIRNHNGSYRRCVQGNNKNNLHTLNGMIKSYGGKVYNGKHYIPDGKGGWKVEEQVSTRGLPPGVHFVDDAPVSTSTVKEQVSTKGLPPGVYFVDDAPE